MNSSLRTLVTIGAIPEPHAVAATMWAADGDLLAPRAARPGQMPRARRPVGPEQPQDVMRYAARRRLRKVEDKLAGKGSPWHRAAHLVARQGMPAAEAAGAMAMPLPAFLGILRQALEDLASIYGPAGGRVA